MIEENPMSIVRKFGTWIAASCFAALGFAQQIPDALADGQYPYAYAINQTDWTLSVIDTGTFAVVTKIPVEVYTNPGVVTPDGAKVYLPSQIVGTISVFNSATNKIDHTISTVAGGSFAIAITPDGRKLYLSNRNGTISEISTATDTVTNTFPGDASALAISPDGKRLYALSGAISIFDTATDTRIGTIQTDMVVVAPVIVLSPDGGKAYVSGNGDDPSCACSVEQLRIIDTIAQTVVTKIRLPTFRQFGLLITPDGSRIYASALDGTAIVSTSANAVITTIPSGFPDTPIGFPRTGAITPGGAYLYGPGSFPGSSQNTIIVIDLNTNKVVRSIPTIDGDTLYVFMGPPRGQSALNINIAGGGTGQVTSAPTGISCQTSCASTFPTANRIMLTATAASGSTFTGWNGGGCIGIEPCWLTLVGDTTISANFVANTPSNIAMASAILPASRSVRIGSVATVFGTVINAGPGTARNCYVAPATTLPLSFGFQTTDSATNALTGTPNSVADIPEGKSQSFILALTPTGTFSPHDVAITFACANANAAPSYSGVNTLLLSASLTPVIDVIGLVATATNDGIIHIDSSGAGAFAVAAANVGNGGTVIALADTGQAALPLRLTICKTDPTTGICFNPAGQTVSSPLGSSETATYSVFASATGAVPFLPAANRIYVRFVDTAGVLRGSTSVAVRTQ
jgi:YVTN family beta-propeller protein